MAALARYREPLKKGLTSTAGIMHCGLIRRIKPAAGSSAHYWGSVAYDNKVKNKLR